MPAERLQKLLSRLGYGSRREIERWIVEGSIKVNGAVATLGDKVTSNDAIIVKGQRVTLQEDPAQPVRILIYHKPVGEICSRRDPLFSQTVFDNLPPIASGRWIQVGRLDVNTSGLLLFTDNGELANRLMHPKFEIEREYAVRVRGTVNETVLRTLQKGVQLEDGMARFKKVLYVGGEGQNTWYHVILTEGRHREVRRLWESQNLTVSRLIRVRYGSLSLPRSLARGKWTELSREEVNAFVSQH